MNEHKTECLKTNLVTLANSSREKLQPMLASSSNQKNTDKFSEYHQDIYICRPFRRWHKKTTTRDDKRTRETRIEEHHPSERRIQSE